MIPLRLQVDAPSLDGPMVVRLRGSHAEAGPLDAALVDREDDVHEYDLAGMSMRLRVPPGEDVEDDVLLLLPGSHSAHRLIRARSPHNTFLVTERCDQLCVMCSQPPKAHHSDLFPYFRQAANLAPRNVFLGLSGGEPMLFKHQVFDLLRSSLEERPDLHFHVLTNGQHFEENDVDELRGFPHDRVLWGVPLYSHREDEHDQIVGKDGAHARLMKSLAVLARSGSSVELRTVALRSNASSLPFLARTVATHLPFVSVWAIMQMESIGYGRKNWDAEFLDTSADFSLVAAAVDVARARGMHVALYNFPLCTVPKAYRSLAPQTISDWKRKYLAGCDGCVAKDLCTGFFEWYPEAKGFSGARPL